MRQGIHRSFTPFWRWLCLVYVCVGAVTLVGCFHLGTRLPNVLPEPIWALVWFGCAAGTWQETHPSVRGSLSILAPALSMASYAIDFLFDQFAASPPSGWWAVDLARCVMWGSVCALIHTITQLDQPRN